LVQVFALCPRRYQSDIAILASLSSTPIVLEIEDVCALVSI
jgi:hypothetical protein